MSAGQARAAILSMLVLPRRRGKWARWRWALAVPTLAIVPRLIGRLWTWILLAVVLGLVVGRIPLFGTLGYELAIAVAVFVTPMSLDVGAALARARMAQPAQPGYPGRALLTSTLSAAALAGGVALVPGVICALRGIVVPTCDWWFGIEAYVALPLCTALLGGALGHAIGVVCGPRRYLGATLALLLPIALVAGSALWRFYAAPPVFTYNAILGYFPGNLYDENVQLELPLLWSRLEQLAWVIGAVALVACIIDVPSFRASRAARPMRRRYVPLLLAGLAFAGAIVLRMNGSYAIDAEDIEDALDGRIETAHFIIHYAKTKDIEEQIDAIAEDHEFRYAEVVKQLGVAPPGKLRSFYFADRDQKARWMGARDVEMAKPWRQEIYLDHRSFPHGSLRHEIAHAVASAFGDPWFGVAMRKVYGIPLASPGLIEGLAVAIDWPGGSYDRMTPHEAVRALVALGKRPSVAQLLSLQFFTVSSTTGYSTAGSFLKYLLDTYGAAPFRALYSSGGDFEGVYAKSLHTLESEWLAMIDKIPLPPEAVEASKERFRGTSLFERPCPHAVAKRHEQAQEANGAGDHDKAISLMRDVCRDAPEEPRYQLDLGDLLVTGDPLEEAEALGRWTRVARDVEGVTSTLRADALDRLSRARMAENDIAGARALMHEALALPVDPNQHRQYQALAFALDSTSPAGPALRGYFFPGLSRVDPATYALLATLAEPSLGLGHYLLGIQHSIFGRHAEATRELEMAIALGLPSTEFVRFAARKLAVSAYRAHDVNGVNIAAATLTTEGMTTSDRLLAQDWRDRLAFDAATSR